MNKNVHWLMALSLFLASSVATAEDFKIGMNGPPSAMDPHASNLDANIMVQGQMFEGLTSTDADNKLIAQLALSWKNVDKLTWEFKLRQGVKFHDGTVMTAEDVVYSLERVKMYKVNAFAMRVDGLAFSIVAPDTIRITTSEFKPTLPFGMAGIAIMSKKASTGVKTDELDAGKGLIGTAPYKFVRFQRGDRLDLARHDGYWGAKPAWSTVTLRFIANPATRLAALLAGDVQAIENVPSPDLAKLRTNPAFTTYLKASTRLAYLTLDANRKVSPFVTAKDGKPLPSNPLMDVRVRQALSMAINRDMIAKRVLEGLGEPAGGLVPSFAEGYDATMASPRYDPEGAKKLLAQAGYPAGFAITLHAPSDRTPNVALAVAAMWARIGVVTKIDGSPISIFYTRAKNFEYSTALVNIDTPGGRLGSMIGALLKCQNAEIGAGGSNIGRYCNTRLDALAYKGDATLDEKARLALYKEAAAIGMAEVGVIPLYHVVHAWSMKKGYAVQAYANGHSYAFAFSKK